MMIEKALEIDLLMNGEDIRVDFDIICSLHLKEVIVHIAYCKKLAPLRTK